MTDSRSNRQQSVLCTARGKPDEIAINRHKIISPLLVSMEENTDAELIEIER